MELSDIETEIEATRKRFEKLEPNRVETGYWATKPGELYGVFLFNNHKDTDKLNVICSPFDFTQEWLHVSVSHETRTPRWEEMEQIKQAFFGDHTAVQFHPPRSEYVNKHPYCLHLWRNITFDFQLPPREQV